MEPAVKFVCIVLCLLLVFSCVASWDPYNVLGVERQADIVTVKRAYKRLAKEWHPDKNTSPQAEEKFVEINKAYEVLSDPERRQRYDRTGQTEDTPNFGPRGGGGPFDAFGREFGGFGGGGGQFRFSFQRHGTMLFHKQAITLRHYENKILPSSRTSPTLLLAFSEWCFGCVQMEPVWASLSEQLQDVGIGVATVHAERERELARRLAVDALPAVYLVVDGRALRYRRDSVSFASITEFVKAKLWPGLLTPLTPSGLGAFLSGWVDNRVRLIIYSQRQSARLRYLALAFRFRGSAAAGFVYTGAPELEPLLTAYGVPARAETLLVLKEDADVVAGRVSMDQLPFRVMVDVMEENKFLSLPRLSSQPVLESLCPMETAASRRRLCAVLVCGSGDPRPELQASLRQFLTSSALSGGRLQYAYIYMDKQARFMEPLLKEAAPADPLGHLLILWRRDHGRVRYLWSEHRWERSVERANETGHALERRLGALLTDDRLLQHEARVQELVDEHAHHLLRRILNKVYHLWETVWEQLSREEVLPALSVVVTIIFLIAGGYLMAYLVRMEEATIQSRYRAQGRPPPTRTTDTPQLRVHEMRVETYNGLVRLLKPGCRTIVLLLDSDSKSRLSARFHRIVWPYRKNKSLMFAFVMLERGLEWYRRLLIPSLPDHQQTLNINPKNCIGTVLSINGYRKYFCMYHAKHAETGGKGGVRRRRTAGKGGATGGGEFMGFDSSNDSNSDLETGEKKKARRAAASDEVLFEEHLLDGLPDWLERLFEGQTVRYHVKYWPDFTGK